MDDASIVNTATEVCKKTFGKKMLKDTFSRVVTANNAFRVAKTVADCAAEAMRRVSGKDEERILGLFRLYREMCSIMPVDEEEYWRREEQAWNLMCGGLTFATAREACDFMNAYYAGIKGLDLELLKYQVDAMMPRLEKLWE